MKSIKELAASIFTRPEAVKTVFRSVPEGKGGTLRIRPRNPKGLLRRSKAHEKLSRHVGTTGLRGCVGVYFAIDKHRCFVAHINPFTDRPLDGEWSDPSIRSQNEADWFRNEVQVRMQLDALEHKWQPANPKTRSIIHKSVILTYTGPRAEGPWSSVPPQQAGDFIVEGIKLYLGLATDFPVQESEAFVTKHPGRKNLVTVEYDPSKWIRTETGEDMIREPALAPELARFRVVKESMVAERGVGDWNVRREV